MPARVITDEQVKIGISRYQNGESISEISRSFGLRPVSLWYQFRKLNIPIRNSFDSRRKIICNDFAFDKVTEESAYWAGFLTADGSIHRQSGYSGRLTLKLSEKDIGHLEKFKKFLNVVHEIKKCDDKVRKKVYKQAYIAISSPYLTEALESYGINEYKSFSGASEKIIGNKHFWRGVIDGDVWVTNVESYGACRIGLCGNVLLMSQFKEFCESCGISTMRIRDHYPKKLFSILLNGFSSIILARLLYKNSNIYLDRKYQKALGIVSKEVFLPEEKRLKLEEILRGE